MSFSSSNHGSSSSVEEMFDEMDQEIVMFIQCAFNLLNFDKLFHNKQHEGTRQSIDPKHFCHNVGHIDGL
jgi:hypothetical protein